MTWLVVEFVTNGSILIVLTLALNVHCVHLPSPPAPCLVHPVLICLFEQLLPLPSHTSLLNCLVNLRFEYVLLVVSKVLTLESLDKHSPILIRRGFGWSKNKVRLYYCSKNEKEKTEIRMPFTSSGHFIEYIVCSFCYLSSTVRFLCLVVVLRSPRCSS